MSTLKKQLKKALEEGNLYDFISNEGRNFEKSELIDIIKNLDYAVYSLCGTTKCAEVEKETIDALNEYCFWSE